MTYSLEDHFRAFLELKRSRKLTASVQAVYTSILGEFYLRDFPAQLSLSTRDLKDLAGLKSEDTVHTAKNVLKNYRLLDFHSTKRETKYFLPDVLPNTQPTAATAVFGKFDEHQGSVSCTQNRADAREKPHADANSLEPVELIEHTITHTHTYTRASALDTDTDTDTDMCVEREKKEKKILPLSVSVSKVSKGGSGGKEAGGVRQTPSDEESVQEFWEREAGYKLFGVFVQELEALDIAYGRENIREALRVAKRWSKNKRRVPFNYFKVVLDDVAIWEDDTEDDPAEGGEKSGENQQPSERPESTKPVKYPWE